MIRDKLKPTPDGMSKLIANFQDQRKLNNHQDERSTNFKTRAVQAARTSCLRGSSLLPSYISAGASLVSPDHIVTRQLDLSYSINGEKPRYLL